MTKKVMFIRHCQLAQPYANYDRLSFAAICQLAMGEVDPGVDHHQIARAVRRVKRLKDKEAVSQIYHATSRRCKQTAAEIKKALEQSYGKKIELIELKELNEIEFNLQKLMKEEEYAEGGMDLVRDRVFNSLIKKDGVETLESVYGRIYALEKGLLSLGEEPILCVTHGFFMRVLQLFFLVGVERYNQVTKNDLFGVVNFSYGDGFGVEFEKNMNKTVGRISQRRKVFSSIRDVPYKVSGPIDDASCVTKSARLARELIQMGLKVRFYMARFDWRDLGVSSGVLALAPDGYIPRHTFIKVLVPETKRYVIVDSVWDQRLAIAGFPVGEWNGFSDTVLGVKCQNIRPMRNTHGEIAGVSEIHKSKVTQEKQKFVAALNVFIEQQRKRKEK